MQRYQVGIIKLAFAPAVSVMVLGLLAGPAQARRRHSAKPVAPPAETVPATEVDAEVTPHAVVAVPAPERASAAVVEKPGNDVPSPPVVSPPSSSPGSWAATREPAETARKRDRSRLDSDLPPGRLTGHVGVGSPLVTLRASRSAHSVGSVNDDFTLVAPIGLGLMLTDHWTFDFEFQVSTGVRPEGLTTAIVDPGVVYAWDRLAAGLRVAWQLNVNQNIGLIPLVRVVVVRGARASWFVEGALPSFVQNKQITASASLQTGIAF